MLMNPNLLQNFWSMDFYGSSAMLKFCFHIDFDGIFIFEACGGAYSGISGSFASPNFPEYYNNNHSCVWTITVEAGKRVELKFLLFNLENRFDYVIIR